MARPMAPSSDPTCPFIDLNDHRCASSFTLGRLDRAFGVCLRRHAACPIFYRIASEQHAAVRSAPATQGAVAFAAPVVHLRPVALTVAGHAPAAVA